MFGKKKNKDKGNLVGVEEFFEATSINPEIEEVDKKKLGFIGVVKALVLMILCSSLAGALIAVPLITTGGFAVKAAEPLADVWKNLPEKLENISIAERNVLYDRNGDVFAQVWSEDRIALESLDDISKYAKQGLISTEDKRFYEHNGIDPRGTVRAAMKGGGGSGITQQLVKNLQFYNMAGKDGKEESVEKSYSRKLKELKLSIGYEKDHTKDEILLGYFNTVAFGGPNVYSIESAAQYFFGKSAKKLDLAESAVLVGSVQNPVIFNLDRDDKKDNWKDRQKDVLTRMVAEGHITKAESDKAYKQKLNLVRKKSSVGNCVSSKYPFYCEYTMKNLKKSQKLGETQEERDAILAKGGLHIKTYMNPAEMDAIDRQLEQDFGNGNRIVAPAATVEPGTGAVTAFGVNRDYGVGEGQTTINVPDNPSGTGSTYKMVTLAAALESGMTEGQLKFGSSCPLYPGPNYDSPNGGFGNSQGCGYQAGNIDYQQATAWSSNTWFLTLAMKTGMNNVLDMTKKLNLSVPNGVSERSLSMVLGSSENSNMDMAAAYATFANEGIFCPATPVESYAYADGTSPAISDTYDPAQDNCRRVMSPHTASVVLKAMRANTYPGYVDNAFSTVAKINGHDAVGKSGTNQNYNYSWVQVSKTHSMFFNVYDMDKLVRGVNGMYYKGRFYTYNIGTDAGADVLRAIFSTGVKDQKLDYNNKDSSLKPVPVESRDYFTVPSVVGMEPAEALSVVRSVGITANVSKETKPKPDGYASGVVVEQSLEPGLQLPVGTKKEIVLYLSK